jgi:hypothetical protein
MGCFDCVGSSLGRCCFAQHDKRRALEWKLARFARRTAEGGCSHMGRLFVHEFGWWRHFAGGAPAPHLSAGLDMFAGVWQAGGMKKQASDQSFHDRRYQERKRAEAAKKVPAKKKVEKKSGESQVPGS